MKDYIESIPTEEDKKRISEIYDKIGIVFENQENRELYFFAALELLANEIGEYLLDRKYWEEPFPLRKVR